MDNIVNSISHNYKGVDYGFDYATYSVAEKSEVLEEQLTAVCNNLAEVNKLMDGKTVNIAYLLSIVASYHMGIQEGEIDADTAETPALLFTESLYPSLDAMEEVEAEVIEEDELLGEPQDITNDEGTDT